MESAERQLAAMAKLQPSQGEAGLMLDWLRGFKDAYRRLPPGAHTGLMSGRAAAAVKARKELCVTSPLSLCLRAVMALCAVKVADLTRRTAALTSLQLLPDEV